MEALAWERDNAADVEPPQWTVLTYADTKTRAVSHSDHGAWAVIVYCPLARFVVRLALPPVHEVKLHHEIRRLLSSEHLNTDEIERLAPFFAKLGVKTDGPVPIGMAFGHRQKFRQQASRVPGIFVYEMVASRPDEQIRDTAIVPYLAPRHSGWSPDSLAQLTFKDVFRSVYPQV